MRYSLVFLAVGAVLLFGSVFGYADGPPEMAWGVFPVTEDGLESLSTMCDGRVDSDGSIVVIEAAVRACPTPEEWPPYWDTTDMVVHRYDAGGEEIWATRVSTSMSELGRSVLFDSSGDIYVVGSVSSDQARDPRDILVYKLTSAGDLLWRRRIPFGEGMICPPMGSPFRAVIDDEDNIYIAAGVILTEEDDLSAASTCDLPVEACVVKIDADANVLWCDVFGTAGDDILREISMDVEGNIYVVGRTEGDLFGENVGGLDAFIVKYAPDGEQLWGWQFGSSDDDIAEAVAASENGAIYVGGMTHGALGPQALGSWDCFIVAFEPSGEQVWVSQFGTSEDDMIRDLVVGQDGMLYAAGLTDGIMGSQRSGDLDVFFGQYNTQGQEQWVEQFGSRRNDNLLRMVVDEQGIYLMGTASRDVFDDASSSGPFLVRFENCATVNE
jgi:hypothetical protein